MRKLNIQKVLLGSFIILTVSQAYAQNALQTVMRGDNGITKHYVTLNASQQVAFSAQKAKTIFNLDANADLVLKNAETDELGVTNYRFYQTYNGIPVENAMYIASTKAGKLTAMSGEIILDFDASVAQKNKANINAQAAINAVLNSVKAEVYAWQDEGMEQRIKDQTKNIKASFVPKAELVWYSPEESLNSKSIVLAYKVDVYAIKPLSRADYFVDAQTGQIIGKHDKIFQSDATGTANTAYSGTQTIHSDFTGSNYRLRDLTKGNGVITLHGESGKRGQDYTSTSSNWNLTGFDQAAMDAHYGVSSTYTFYYKVFKRNSYDGNGTALYSYVNDPTYTDNAFWDGSAMNFNKRSTGAPGGVTGIDVTGHELTHGVTQTTSALVYSKEPGAINESMSDIMGKLVQFYTKPNDINWQLSNDMNWIIRDMSNPKLMHQPNTYKGQYWVSSIFIDNGGVHTNSGIGNFFFYLLVNGGTGTNDNGSTYTVQGIGFQKAAKIIYRTETVYLFPNAQYADWRNACISAATDLYGASSNAVKQVKNAWYAVGVGTAAFADIASNLSASKVGTVKITPNLIAGGNAVVNYQLTQSGTTALRVADLNGRVMQNVALGNLKAGSYNYTLNAGALPKGTYVVMILQNGALISRNNFIVEK